MLFTAFHRSLPVALCLAMVSMAAPAHNFSNSSQNLVMVPDTYSFNTTVPISESILVNAIQDLSMPGSNMSQIIDSITPLIETDSFVPTRMKNPLGHKTMQDFISEESTREEYPFSDGVFEQLGSIADYAKIAYCATKSYTPMIGELKDFCPEMGFCTDSNAKEIIYNYKSFENKKESSGRHYISVDHEKKDIILSFRGTDSMADWITNAEYGPHHYSPVLDASYHIHQDYETIIKAYKDFKSSQGDENSEDPYEGLIIHFGIYRQYKKIIFEAAPYIKEFVLKGYQLKITGHSLGGAYACLAGLDFQLAGYKPIVVNYSSMRVGNDKFNDFVDFVFNTRRNYEIVKTGGLLPPGSFTRVIQLRDPVHFLPPIFEFISSELYNHCGLLFEVDKLVLPHVKKDLVFRGVTQREDKWTYLYKVRAWLKAERDSIRAKDTKLERHAFCVKAITSPCIDGYYERGSEVPNVSDALTEYALILFYQFQLYVVEKLIARL